MEKVTQQFGLQETLVTRFPGIIGYVTLDKVKIKNKVKICQYSLGWDFVLENTTKWLLL